jgi:anti-anti-sigma regulatory factor
LEQNPRLCVRIVSRWEAEAIMVPKPPPLKVAPITNGCCIRVEGHATMTESEAAAAVAQRTLGSGDHSVVVFDLSDCVYLDSTFIGCLVSLARTHAKSKPARFMIAGPALKRKQLLGACGVDRIIPATDVAPDPCGDWVPLWPAPGDKLKLMRHVMECHRTLSQIDSPMKAAFARIADEIEKDLTSPPPRPS